MENKLTSTQKSKLRRKYAYYKSIDRSDYDTYAEYHNDCEEARVELVKMMVEFGLRGDDLDNLERLIYSENQLLFIKDAEEANGRLHYDYSGRGMLGDVCPALYCDSHNDITTKAKTVIDSMGLGIVIYAQY